ncbi:MAG: hypothetical protein N3H31_07410 [Candidatus Nezhaarchaeota archaeon]|nr:hypothetical protein [Candidatus Nezhaarchaeota archaeon]
MTGEAEGKLKIPCEVRVVTSRGVKRLDAEVFIHVKGYSLARVTHLDIEHPELDGVLPPRGGGFFTIEGVAGGLRISFKPAQRGVSSIEVASPLLNEVLGPGESTRTWVGGKLGGIYVGFRREEVRKLEGVAQRVFRVEPR